MNDTSSSEKVPGLSGLSLKVIACVTMFIDHFGAAVIYRALVFSGNPGNFVTADNYATWLLVYNVMRGIGRMAFPIFCYLIVEGFKHTRNSYLYAVRLLIFAVVSEVPFDVALEHAWFSFNYNNVYFTLLLGLIAIIGMDLLQKKMPETDPDTSRKPGNRRYRRSKSYYDNKTWAGKVMEANDSWQRKRKFVTVTGNLAIAVTFMLIAQYVIHCDYGAVGVLAIILIYLIQDERFLIKGKPLVGYAISILLLGLLSSPLEFFALFTLIPLYFYNGTRGHQIKYFFYAFYPVHLALMVLISWAMGFAIFF